jgi:hypothetical protein
MEQPFGNIPTLAQAHDRPKIQYLGSKHQKERARERIHLSLVLRAQCVFQHTQVQYTKVTGSRLHFVTQINPWY